jgi:haloacetate dehalogenase
MNGTPLFAEVNGIRIAYEKTGQGYPLLLLHGFPRTHRVWSRVTPALARRFTVVAPDRRGYGDSDRPTDSASYDNANMTQDALGLARHLGWTEFLVVGHDRGSPDARRLVGDHPDVVRGAMILDGLPEGVKLAQRQDTTGRQWYFDFFRQRGVAEQLIGQNPRLFFSLFLDRNPHLSREEHEYYVQMFCRPGTVEAILADYRAGLEVDRVYWEEQVRAGRKLRTPLYVVWGAQGPAAGAPVLEAWRQVAESVRGEAVPESGHYVQEQQPEAVARHILRFADELGLP